MIDVRRRTVLADARTRHLRRPEALVAVSGRRCRGCGGGARVGAEADWPRQPGPFSTPAFATAAVVVVAVAAVAMVVMASASGSGA